MKDKTERPTNPGGASSLANLDASAQTSEKDLKPGERRRGGQDVEDEE
jgi:hypothetical protein